MKLLIQKVNYAKLINEDLTVESINKGILVYVGIHRLDTIKDVEFCVNKLVNLRFLEDENNKMNLSYNDIKYDIMVISNFSLYGDFKKGNRPSFVNSLNLDAKNLYDLFILKLKQKVSSLGEYVIKCGVFKTDMKIISENDGPLNLILDTQN